LRIDLVLDVVEERKSIAEERMSLTAVLLEDQKSILGEGKSLLEILLFEPLPVTKPLSVYVAFRTITQKVEARVAKFSSRDDLEKPGCDYDLEPNWAQIRVTGLQNGRSWVALFE